MGQQTCSLKSQEASQTINHPVFDEPQVPIDQENDEAPSESRFQFLKTEVVASWNILEETTKSNIEIRTANTNFTFCNQNSSNGSSRLYETENVPSNEDFIIEKIYPSEAGQDLIQKFLKSGYKDKYKQKTYENLEIDMSDFIKIRNENVKDFYQFLEKIGEGTFGSVFRSIEKKTGQIRAIKALKKKSMNGQSRMMFAAQIDLLKTLNHPNIIKLYDLFLWDGNYYLITQFCEGGCLQKYLKDYKNNIPEQILKGIMKQIVSVINYLYSSSVVHRDLKLENVVLLNKVTQESKEFEIKLIDFGTATKVQRHKKNDSKLVGTLLYLAPEFIKGFFTEKCDIWSVGIMFYRLIFRDFPFKGRTQKEILAQIVNKEIEWDKLNMGHISESGKQFLKLMLDKNYLSRASSKTLVQHEWIKDTMTQRVTSEMKDHMANSLAFYNRKNNFVSVIESFLSFKKVTQKQRHELAQMFFEIDNDQSGLIEAQQLIQFLKKKYPEFQESKILKIVQNVDKNNSGKIDFNEFIVAMAQKSKLFAEEALQDAFDYVDQDRTGYITKKELKTLLKEADRRQIEEVFQNIDLDGDNKISFEQFRNYLLNV